jgi:FMN phosphatase YigB (HAD superfamily)
MHPDLNEHQVEAVFCDVNGTLLQQRDPEYEAQVLVDILRRWHFSTRVSASQLHDELAELHDEALTGQYSESDLAMYTMGAAKVRVQQPIALFLCRHWASLTSQHIQVAPSVFEQFRVMGASARSVSLFEDATHIDRNLFLALGLVRQEDRLLLSCDLWALKGSRHGVRALLRSSRRSAESCLMVTCDPGAANAAREAGMQTLVVRHLQGHNGSLLPNPGAGAEHPEIDSIDQLCWALGLERSVR